MFSIVAGINSGESKISRTNRLIHPIFCDSCIFVVLNDVITLTVSISEFSLILSNIYHSRTRGTRYLDTYVRVRVRGTESKELLFALNAIGTAI